MFKIKYAGPRPVINQHGVFFKDGKEDKYNFLLTALKILLSLDSDTQTKQVYKSMIESNILDEPKIHKILAQYDSELEKEVEEEEKNYEKHLQEEIDYVKNLSTISEIEKEAWVNNLLSMKEYMIQRAINKIYYMHCIEDIANIILKKSIKKIVVPFDKNFWHVLHTIQGKLENLKHPKNTKLSEETLQDGSMIVKLEILD